MALRLMRVCVCGHGREDHVNTDAIPFSTENKGCRWVQWTVPEDPTDAHASAFCSCKWWRPLLIPRLRNVPMEHPMIPRRSS